MGARVLVVDDDPWILRMVTATLQKRDYIVDTAREGQQALERAAANPPDVIISDVMMPVMDGWTFVQQLRQDPRLSSIPVIFLTALGKDEAKIAQLGLSPDDFLSKPFRFDALEKRVASALVRPAAPEPAATPYPPQQQAPNPAGYPPSPGTYGGYPPPGYPPLTGPPQAAPPSQGYPPGYGNPPPTGYGPPTAAPQHPQHPQHGSPPHPAAPPPGSVGFPPPTFPTAPSQAQPAAPPAQQPPQQPAQQPAGHAAGPDPLRAPPATSEMRAIGDNTAPRRTTALNGRLEQLQLSSLLVMMEMERKDGLLSLKDSKSGAVGRIFLRGGQVIAAKLTDNPAAPRDCVYEMLCWKAGTFSFNAMEVDMEDTIKSSTTHLLMEGARLIDEANRDEF